MTRTRFSKRFLSIILCIALTMTYIPLLMTTALSAARDSLNTSSDPSTLNGWQEYFPMGNNITTENAGGIWTDKTVMDLDGYTALRNEGQVPTDMAAPADGEFIVALSAMGSNMTITGMGSVPTDTMLVLDVSGSMQSSASSLVTAANQTIQALLATSKYSRVGVVLYSGPSYFGSSSGNDATLILPLNRYTTEDTQGRFLNISSNTISIDNEVYIEGTSNQPTRRSKSVQGGTYIQNGINLAKNQFTATANQTTVDDPNAGTITRKPIMVLMSDGAPTLASTNFTNPTNSTMGDGDDSTAPMGFVTQLSMSYAKQQMEEKYKTDALFYTLSVGLTTSTEGYEIARAVLDPSNTYTDAAANALREDWDNYLLAAPNTNVRIAGSIYNPTNVRKIEATLEEEFVDGYFAATDSNDLVSAFEEIVNDISLHSKYFPTLTEENENLSGYITFVDRIGKYMEVTNVRGIRLSGHLFSGADLASNFVAGGGNLGTYDKPSTLGDEMVWAVQQRLGLADTDTARTLIGLAYDHGQLAYNATTGEFSNYIGWFADASGKFLGFWYEGIDASTIPEGAVSIMKSYGYLGETDALHGVEKSDMMYATVQLKEDIATGEQTITFAVPAALIPTVTYEVTLDESGDLIALASTGATAPIRLVYTIGLREEINEFTMNEIVDADYINANTNADGSVNFYTNQYEVSGATGFDDATGQIAVNTYSYFRPSKQNNSFYYQQDALLYTAPDINAVYMGEARPEGQEIWCGHTIYVRNGDTLTTETEFHTLSAETIGIAVKHQDNTWHIPIGTVRQNYVGYVATKAENTTGTLSFSATPFVDIYGHSVDEANHFFVVGATLGNNGKLVMNRETGIKITKTLAQGITDNGVDFEFILTNTTNENDDNAYPAYRVDANGNATDTTIRFVNGVASNILIKADEALYIGGMAEGDVITITEVETDKYTVQSVNNALGTSVDIEIVANEFANADFINTERGTGNLTVAKEIEHDFGTDYVIPDAKNSFTMNVTLTLNGKALANKTYTAKQTLDSSVTSVTTLNDGSFEIVLTNGDQIELIGLPEGTVATVVEELVGDEFTAIYWENGYAGDGEVKIQANRTESILVVNKYEATSVSPNIQLSGVKTLKGDIYNGEFSFKLQRAAFDAASNTWTWSDIGSVATVSYDAQNGNKSFEFGTILNNEVYDEIGDYIYQVIEVAGDDPKVTYDAALHSFTVHVTDKDMDGALEISSVTTTRPSVVDINTADGLTTIVTSFVNEHSNDAKTSVTIDLQKSVLNTSGSPNASSLAGFGFVLDGDIATPVTLETNSLGAIRFSLNYTLDDLNNQEQKTFNYTLKEVIPTDTNAAWDYDEKVINITVVVTYNDDNTISAVITDNDLNASNADNAIEVAFENSYNPTEAELTLDFINKELTGRELNDQEFEFKLVPLNSSVLVDAEGNAIGEIIGKNDVYGNVNFTQPLYFDSVGVYYYEISEVKGELGGIKYDDNKYQIVVTVTDTDGVLTATAQVINVQGNEIMFENSYTTAPIPYAFGGIKELTGRALLNDEFTFTLTEALDANGTVAEGARVYTAKNTVSARSTATGGFKFPEITYTEAGTYYYVISEQGPTSDNTTYGITFSDATYVVAVSIIDNGKGELVIESVSHEAEDVIFINSYKANPTNAIIDGSKILQGRVLNNAEFSFELYESNADWDNIERLETVQNAEDGKFAFEAIDFNEAGTYYFLVKEVQGDKGGVTYDESIFRIRIEITDDLRGQLHSSVFIYDEYDNPQASMVFVNIYTVSGTDTVILEGEKILDGRDIVDGEFEFELYITDENYTIPEQPEETKVNDGKEFEFKLEYFPEDIGNTYYYAVKEANAGETVNGTKYSDTIYRISVLVEDDGLGGIKTTTTIINNGGFNSDKLQFVNIFAAEAEVEINIDKTVDNVGTMEIAAEGFSFKLQKDGENEFASVVTDENGKAGFVLDFTQEDIGKTYDYTLSEINDGRSNVTYSEKVYEFSIEVSLGDENQLVATIISDEQAIDELNAEFTNIYDYTPPQTGDYSNMWLWYVILFISLGGVVGNVIYTKKTGRTF